MDFKRFLDKKNMSMYRLANEAGVGVSTVHEIISGKRKRITLEVAIKLAKVLEVDVETIYKWVGGENDAN